MSRESDGAFIRRFYDEVINQRRLGEALSAPAFAALYFAPEFLRTIMQEGIVYAWPDTAHVETMLDNTYPDFRLSIEDVIAEAGKVVVRWTTRSTHEGTGKWVRWEGVSIYHLQNGKISRVWSFADELHPSRTIRTEAQPLAGDDALVLDEPFVHAHILKETGQSTPSTPDQ